MEQCINGKRRAHVPDRRDLKLPISHEIFVSTELRDHQLIDRLGGSFQNEPHQIIFGLEVVANRSKIGFSLSGDIANRYLKAVRRTQIDCGIKQPVSGRRVLWVYFESRNVTRSRDVEEGISLLLHFRWILAFHGCACQVFRR